MNNVASFKDWIGGVLYETKYTYDKDSRQTSTVGAGLTRLWNYDAYGRTKEIITKNAAGQQILKSEPVYPIPDSAHTIPRANGWRNTAAGFSQLLEYGYYSSGNISIVRDNVNGSNYEVRYSYDKLSRLTAEFNGKKDRKYVYAYDSSGNITSKKEYRWSDNALLHTYNYTYGDATWGDLLTGYDGRTITSDTIGNMTNDGIWRYTWEHGRQLASQRKISTGQVISYTYDADGLRLSKMIGNNGKKYFYDKGRLSCMVNVINGANSDSYYIHYDAEGNPAFISASVNGAIRERFAYLRNMQGDIIGLVNESGAVVVRYYYDAWGKLLQTEVSDSAYNDIAEKNPLRYRGYVYDAETGFYYLSGRYYNPDICRFVSIDDIELIRDNGKGLAEKNQFLYCDDNPINREDFSGNSWTLAFPAACGAVSAITQYAFCVIENISDGKRALNAFVPSSSQCVEIGAAAISGALSAVGISPLKSMALDAAITASSYVLGCIVDKEKSFKTSELISKMGASVISSCLVDCDFADAKTIDKKDETIQSCDNTRDK